MTTPLDFCQPTGLEILGEFVPSPGVASSGMPGSPFFLSRASRRRREPKNLVTRNDALFVVPVKMHSALRESFDFCGNSLAGLALQMPLSHPADGLELPKPPDGRQYHTSCVELMACPVNFRPIDLNLDPSQSAPDEGSPIPIVYIRPSGVEEAIATIHRWGAFRVFGSPTPRRLSRREDAAVPALALVISTGMGFVLAISSPSSARTFRSEYEARAMIPIVPLLLSFVHHQLELRDLRVTLEGVPTTRHGPGRFGPTAELPRPRAPVLTINDKLTLSITFLLLSHLQEGGAPRSHLAQALLLLVLATQSLSCILGSLPRIISV
ncbi:hypothetical protein C8J57DRAFT_1515448 [Mycena rebaudengoi]|nr:hypothetical protein C8J57DRAFT_1515448 [Mycena rebaudengoi]